jgi:hypothetical protein
MRNVETGAMELADWRQRDATFSNMDITEELIF